MGETTRLPSPDEMARIIAEREESMARERSISRLPPRQEVLVRNVFRAMLRAALGG